jgi:peroxiredoxin
MLLFTLFVVAPAAAGEFNKVLSVGDAAPNFEGLKGTDEKAYALKDFTADCVAVVFTCNGCPVAQDYEERTVAAAKKYGVKVQFVAINSNTGADESLKKMAERAKKKEYPFPYLADPDGTVARAYGARYTPEFVLLDKSRKVAYLGAFDDKNKAADAKITYVTDAIDAVLAGKTPNVRETLGRGCKIKLKVQ